MGKVTKILLVGMYDTNTVSLAPQILKHYVEQFDIAKNFDIATREFSIFSDSGESIVCQIQKESPDVVGFSAYVWNINEILEIIKHLEATIIIGGSQVTGIEEKLMQDNPAIDIIVSGEGEETFKELLEYFSGQRHIDTINGITTRDIKTYPRKIMPDLKAIPPIYKNIFSEHPDITWVSFETSRGCPMECKFCAWSYSKKMRYYGLERVRRELDIILSQDNIQDIYLCDSSLLFNKERAKEIFKFIIAKQAGKSMRFEFSAEQLDDEIIMLLSRMPNNEFNFGLQSIKEEPLKIMGRKFDRVRFEENYNKILEACHEPNITIDVIYGLPGDNIDGFKETLDYAISLNGVKRILANPLVALPGSQFFSELDTYGITLKDEKSYLIEETATFSKEQMEEARRYSFYVSAIFLNKRLVECIKSFARSLKKRYIDIIIKFMDNFPSGIIGKEYPDMIPSVREGFNRRNLAMREIISGYDALVDYFNMFSGYRYVNELGDYRACFSRQYNKFKRLTCT